MTVLVVAVAAVAGINSLRTSAPSQVAVSEIGPYAGASSFLSLSCGGVAAGPGTSTTRRVGGRPASPAVARKIVDAVVGIYATIDNGGAAGQAAATGIVVSPDGEVLTTNYSIAGATSIKVTVGGSTRSYPAHVIGYSTDPNIALLQIDGASNLKTMPFGDSSKVEVGDKVIAIGEPSGAGRISSSRGTVTGLDQPVVAGDANSGGTERLSGMIKAKAAIEPGDAGGVLVDAQGYAIGILEAADTGVAFATPVNDAGSAVTQICGGSNTNSVHVGPRAILGVQLRNISPPISRSANSPRSGASVVAVEPNSAAAEAGIVAGDVLTTIDGRRTANVSALTTALFPYRPGDRVRVGWVDAAGTGHTADVTLQTGPPG